MKKIILITLGLLLLIGLTGCRSVEKEIMVEENIHKVLPLYGDSYVAGIEYDGIDMEGLEQMNLRYGSKNYGDANVSGGCSITFAEYYDGTIGAIRNMDLQISKNCEYELIVNKGENVKYPFWALAYTGADEKSYQEVINEGLSDDRYKQLPFTATDTMSFGYLEDGNEAALYCAILMRSSETDDEGNYLYTCSGTYPGAPIRCATHSVAALIASNSITIDEALKLTGAVDEEYNRIFPEDAPLLDVYTFNIEVGDVSNHWFEVIAMEDSSGRHGVLEFMDNYAIWHEGQDYSFNYFLQKEYLYNEDGTYREQHGAGIGRASATLPYLSQVKTKEEHLALMNSVSYSRMTYYNEEAGYTGKDIMGNPVDWRTEFTGLNVFENYSKMKKLGLDTEAADEKYPLYSTYLNLDTNEYVRINSLEEYEKEKDHLKDIYTMNFVLDPKNYEEVMNYIRWSGLFYSSLSDEEVRLTNSGWETVFKVIADPMNKRVTRYFNENVSTADTFTFEDIIK